MTVDSPLWRALRRIRDAEIPAADRELLRPAFAALDGGVVIHVPPRSQIAICASLAGCSVRCGASFLTT